MVQTSPWKDALHAGPPPRMADGIFAFAVAFTGLALYLVLEINVTVLRKFKKRHGLYFWSLLVASWGVCFHGLGYVLLWWVPGSPWVLNTAFILFGWSMMVTGQSLVLYSRLHLVIRNHTILRAVLIMIISTCILIEIPQWVTTWASTDTKLSVTKLWSPWDSIMVRISQLAFILQEGTLSILYIWGTIKILKPNDKINLRRLKFDLIAINTYIILVDILILVLAYTNEHIPKEPTQNFAYAFKLKIEFVVLNQLMSITSKSQSSGHGGSNRYMKGSSSGSGLARSKPSTDGAPLSPGSKEQYNLTTLSHGSKSPGFTERSPSDSSGNTTKVADSPLGVYAKEGPDYISHRSRSDAFHHIDDAMKPAAQSHTILRQGLNNHQTSRATERNQIRHDLEENDFHDLRYHSSENLTPRPVEPVAVHSRPDLQWSSGNWVGRLWSKIPSGEQRLQKDLSRV